MQQRGFAAPKPSGAEFVKTSEPPLIGANHGQS